MSETQEEGYQFEDSSRSYSKVVQKNLPEIIK